MANPWENDPVIENATPWANDPVDTTPVPSASPLRSGLSAARANREARLTDRANRAREQGTFLSPVVDAVSGADRVGGILGAVNAFANKAQNYATLGLYQTLQNAKSGKMPFDNDDAMGLGDVQMIVADTHPEMATLGSIAGSLAPYRAGTAMLSGAAKLPIVRQTVRGLQSTRPTAFLSRLMGSGAAGYGAAQVEGATTLASENSAYTGQSPSLQERLQTGQDVANFGPIVETPVGDVPVPISAAVGPAGILAKRAGVGVQTGGRSFTSQDVREDIATKFGRQSMRTNGAADVLNAIAVSQLRPQAFSAVERIFERAGLSSDDIRALNAEVANRLKAATGGAAARKTVAQHIIDVVGEYRPQVSQVVLQQLRELNLVARPGQNSPGIISSVTNDLVGSQSDFLGQSANRNIAGGSRADTRAQILQAKSRLSAEYERVLNNANPTPAQLSAMIMLIRKEPNYQQLLSRRATAEGFESVDAYIAAKPVHAAHYMRSNVSTAARTATGAEEQLYASLRDQFDDALDQVDGYQAVKRRWGTEESLLRAQTFGDRLFGSSSSRIMNNPGLQDEIIAEFDALPVEQKAVALQSIRDAAMAPLRGGPENAAARLTALQSNSSLAFLERIGAKDFADDVRAIRDEQDFIRRIDPEANSRTIPNAEAIRNAGPMRDGTLARMADGSSGAMGDAMVGAGVSMALPGIGPWAYLWPARRALSGAGKTMFQTRTDTLDDISRFFMMRPGDTAKSPVNRIGRVNGQDGLRAFLRQQGNNTTQQASPWTQPVPSNFNPSPGNTTPAGANSFPTQAGSDADLRPNFDAPIQTEDNLPLKPRDTEPNQQGFISGDLLNSPTATGAIAGGTIGAINPDLNGDGRVTPTERLMGIGIGLVGGGAAGRLDARMLPRRGASNGVPTRNTNLAMDEASRLRRGREMGFDTDKTLYHGTANDITQFDPVQAGRVTGSRSAKLGTWMAGSPDTAGGYASYATETKPVQDLIEASYAAERRGNWEEANRLMQQAETLEQQIMRDGGQGANVMPLVARGNLKKIDMEGVQYDPDDVDLTRMAQEAKSEGYDGVTFQNFSDEADYGVYRPTEHTLIFEPKNIRSKFARFDPAQSDSPILTAGLPMLQPNPAAIAQKVRQPLDSPRALPGEPRTDAIMSRKPADLPNGIEQQYITYARDLYSRFGLNPAEIAQYTGRNIQFVNDALGARSAVNLPALGAAGVGVAGVAATGQAINESLQQEGQQSPFYTPAMRITDDMQAPRPSMSLETAYDQLGFTPDEVAAARQSGRDLANDALARGRALAPQLLQPGAQAELNALAQSLVPLIDQGVVTPEAARKQLVKKAAELGLPEDRIPQR